MSSRLRQRVAFVLLAAAILGWETHSVLTPAREVFRTAWTARDLAAFGRGGVVSQVFSVGTEIEPLTAVSIRMRASGSPARVEWTLEESFGSERHTFTALHRGRETVTLDGEAWVPLTFPPRPAWNREFKLSLRLLDPAPPHVALRYSPTGAYSGALAVDEREELGDLLLAATGESLLARVRRLVATSQSSVATGVVGGVVLLFHAALFGLLFLLVFGPRQSRRR